MLKKALLFIFMLICSAGIFAAPIKQIVFFGDSLSDNGNLYDLFVKIIPKSPPYFLGRFSNGPTWAENVGKYYYDNYYVDYQIYAYGGATAAFYLPTTEFVSPTTLQLEVSKYIIDAVFRDKSNVLYVIWIGGNDYLYHQDGDAKEITQNVVDKIEWAVTTLSARGAKNFLVLNLPDLSKTPFARSHGSYDKLKILTQLHNEKLAETVKKLKNDYPNAAITFINVYDMLNELIENPAKYNQQYNINITNTSESCWLGGYTLKNLIKGKSLEDEIRQTLLTKDKKLANEMDIKTISTFIQGTPSIAEAYRVSKMAELGITPCLNADEHVFWDQIHPTQVVHRVLSQIVIQQMTARIAAK